MYKHDMHLHLSKVDDQFLSNFCSKYAIGPEYKPTAPQPHHRITDCPDGYIAVYTNHFEFSNLRIPFSLFLLEFLKQYNLNISQLAPLGAIKVTLFEIACRALGGQPSLPLFRQFFKLTRYGDWFNVEKRMTPGCVSTVPKYLKQWKDEFFWVSADVIPFKMRWRQFSEPLNVIDPDTEDFDRDLYRLLLEHPTPQQPLPEHVLIMTGLSRNWPYLDSEPILKDGDEEMSLLKYIEGKGVGVVKLTWRFLAVHEEHILVRTKGICYQGPGCQGLSREPERMPDLVVGSEIKLEPLVAPGPDNVPESDVHVLNRVGCFTQPVESVPELVTSWYERKAKRKARFRDRASRFRVRMTVQSAENAKLAKKVRKLKKLQKMTVDKGKEAIWMLAKNTIEHMKLVEALENEMENARDESEEKLKQAHEELQLKEEMVEKLKQVNQVEECVSLKESLERVSAERRWLIEEGFGYVINRLLKSSEYNKLLGAVQTNLWESGAHYGLVKSYESCKDGAALEDVSLYKPEAHMKFLKAVHELEHTRFPYIVALSQCADRTVDELKALEPVGMEEDEAEAGGDQL